MSDLIDQYKKSGIVSDSPLRYFRACECCGKQYHMDDLTTIDVDEPNGNHNTILVCDECLEQGE